MKLSSDQNGYPADGSGFGTRGVLVAEDSPLQAVMLRRLLQSSGYEVLQARDGAEALERLRAHPVGLVVADVRMPRMDGYELCRTVKADAALSDVPVLLLTALTEPTDLLLGLEAGADGYVTKPYDHEVLLRRVSELWGRRPAADAEPAAEVDFAGQRCSITASRQQILNLLLSTYEIAAQQNRALGQAQNELIQRNRQLEEQRGEAERLLLNVLPRSVAEELTARGRVAPVKVDDATVMFTDFEGFSTRAASMAPEELLGELEVYLDEFERVAAGYRIERLKGRGDGCLFVAGVPSPRADHAVDCVRAALELQGFVERRAGQQRARGAATWRMRVGVHSGPVVAGVIGQTHFAYDVWGDTVSTASRIQSGGAPGRVSISSSTHDKVSRWFRCSPVSQGAPAGALETFLVDGVRNADGDDGSAARDRSGSRLGPVVPFGPRGAGRLRSS